MAFRRITGKEFETLGYDRLPLNRVLREYQKGIAPDRIQVRLQNLEEQLDALENQEGVFTRDINQNTVEFDSITEGASEVLWKMLLKAPAKKPVSTDGWNKVLRGKTREWNRALRTYDKRTYSLQQAKENERVNAGRLLDFQRNYSRELEAIYGMKDINSQRIVDKDFALERLTRTGKSSRVAEAGLIAQYGIIPAQELFDPESKYLSADERIQLSMTISRRKYAIPLNILIAYVEDLTGRIQSFSRMVSDANELKGNIDMAKLHSAIQQLRYERDALYDSVIQRTSGGLDADI